MGYVDRELMDISTYNIYRLNDLDAVTSPEIINWVKENNVELITYNDIVNGMK
ncbi:Chitooligosaccharide deacetylase [compost metagenome]